MTIRYVDSVGGDDSDGLTKAKAYATLQQAITDWTTGDVIWMEELHRENPASLSLTLPSACNRHNPVVVMRVDYDDDSYSPAQTGDTANVETSSGTLVLNNGVDKAIIVYGVYFKAADDMQLAEGGDSHATLIDCGFETVGTGAYFNPSLDGELCWIQGGFLKLTSMIWPRGEGLIKIDGLTVTGTCHTSFSLFYLSDANEVICNGCDFSGVTNLDTAELVDGDVMDSTSLNLNHCTLPTNLTDAQIIQNTIVGMGRVKLNNCERTSNGSTRNIEWFDTAGEVRTNETVYLTAGFTHAEGDTNQSILMEPSTSCVAGYPLEGIPIVSYLDSTGSKTFTVQCLLQITGGGSAPTMPTDQELWFDIEYLGTSSSTLWSMDSTRSGTAGQLIDDPDPYTATAHTDTNNEANWTGEAANSKTVALARTVTVNKAGHYRITPYLATNETNLEVYYDPKATIT